MAVFDEPKRASIRFRPTSSQSLCASCQRLKSIIRDGSVNTLRISSTLCVARERRTWFTATTRITSHRTGARVRRLSYQRLEPRPVNSTVVRYVVFAKRNNGSTVSAFSG